jgi:uncharacterized membrane protein YfcA
MTALVDSVNGWLLAYSLACVLGAAVVRGFSGFGFSLLTITALSLALDPARIIPSIFILEIVASLSLLPGVWREAQWRSIGWLILGVALFTPAGVWLLAAVPAAPMKLALGLFVFATALLLMRGFVMKRMPNRIGTVATGAAAGLLNGAFGIGGPPLILFFFNSPAGAAVGRASVIALFVLIDVVGLVFLAHQGLVTQTSLLQATLFLPMLWLGVWIGHHSFRKADPAAFKRWVLRLLMLMAVLTAAQGAAGLAG